MSESHLTVYQENLSIGHDFESFPLENPAKKRKQNIKEENEAALNFEEGNEDFLNIKEENEALLNIKENGSLLSIKEENEDSLHKRVFGKPWLQDDQLSHYAFCSTCKITISATTTKLLSHSRSKTHLKNVNAQQQGIKLPEDKALSDSETAHNHNLRIIDFRSDALSVPSKGMIYAMIEAQTKDSAFDTDENVKELEDIIAQMLNKESALIFPTHTMANLVAVLTHCQSRGSTVIAGSESDIGLNNQEALVKFGGLHFIPLDEFEDGTFSLKKLERLLTSLDHRFPLSCVVCYECPHLRKGGVVPPFEWIHQLEALCLSEDIFLHCDGTRLINAALSQDLELSSFVHHCDSVTFAFDKSLGAPIGAVLTGKEVFIKRAAFIRNFIGGHIHQAGTFAAAGTFTLNQALVNIDWNHDKAKGIASAIAQMQSSCVSVDVSKVHTNVIHLHCKSERFTAKHLRKRLSTINEDEENHFEKENVLILAEDINRHTLSLVVHNNLSENDIKATIEKLIWIIKELQSDSCS